tara:strand:+ start:323 stop:541 length:219 start_codon:yes stop_codon:yes gene_type:complete
MKGTKNQVTLRLTEHQVLNLMKYLNVSDNDIGSPKFFILKKIKRYLEIHKDDMKRKAEKMQMNVRLLEKYCK